MINISYNEPIMLGTDVDLVVTAMVDHAGQAVDPLTAVFEYTFYCGNKTPYKVTNTEHSKVVDGVLHLVLEAYPFTSGTLHYIETWAIPNAAFADGIQTVKKHYDTQIEFVDYDPANY